MGDVTSVYTRFKWSLLTYLLFRFCILMWPHGLQEDLILRTFAANSLQLLEAWTWLVSRQTEHSLWWRILKIRSLIGQGLVFCFIGYQSIHSDSLLVMHSWLCAGFLLFQCYSVLYSSCAFTQKYTNTHTESCLPMATEQLSWSWIGLHASLRAFCQQCIHK